MSTSNTRTAAARDLSTDELNAVSGGIHITKKTDMSSPLFMLNCAAGASVPKLS